MCLISIPLPTSPTEYPECVPPPSPGCPTAPAFITRGIQTAVQFQRLRSSTTGRSTFIVSEAIQNAGFAPLLLDPIDFAAAYMAQMQATQGQQGIGENAEAPGADDPGDPSQA